jgi:hypothetical protein
MKRILKREKLKADLKYFKKLISQAAARFVFYHRCSLKAKCKGDYVMLSSFIFPREGHGKIFRDKMYAEKQITTW